MTPHAMIGIDLDLSTEICVARGMDRAAAGARTMDDEFTAVVRCYVASCVAYAMRCGYRFDMPCIWTITMVHSSCVRMVALYRPYSFICGDTVTDYSLLRSAVCIYETDLGVQL